MKAQFIKTNVLRLNWLGIIDNESEIGDETRECGIQMTHFECYSMVSGEVLGVTR